MRQITSPIKNKAQGSEVANLHEGLGLLGIFVTKSDITNQTFGESTAIALSQVQEKYHLPITKEVDVVTAKILNELLDEKRAFEPNGGNGHMRVFGKITDTQKKAVQGLKILAFDKDIRAEELLGQSI